MISFQSSLLLLIVFSCCLAQNTNYTLPWADSSYEFLSLKDSRWVFWSFLGRSIVVLDTDLNLKWQSSIDQYCPEAPGTCRVQRGMVFNEDVSHLIFTLARSNSNVAETIALDIDGNVVWSYKWEFDVSDFQLGSTSAGNFAFVSSGNNITTLDAQSGKYLWMLEDYNITEACGDSGISNVNVDSTTQTIVLACGRAAVWARDFSGNLRWSRTDYSIPQYLVDDGSLITFFYPKMSSSSVVDLTEHWTVANNGTKLSGALAAINPNNNDILVWLGASKWALSCYAENGTPLWTTPYVQSLYGPNLIIGIDGNYYYTSSAANGYTVNKFNTNGQAVSKTTFNDKSYVLLGVDEAGVGYFNQGRSNVIKVALQ